MSVRFLKFEFFVRHMHETIIHCCHFSGNLDVASVRFCRFCSLSCVFKPFRIGRVYRNIELFQTLNKESTEFFYSLLGDIFQTKKYLTWPIEFIFQTFTGYLFHSFPFHISHITLSVLEQQKYNSADFESAECIILYRAPVG